MFVCQDYVFWGVCALLREHVLNEQWALHINAIDMYNDSTNVDIHTQFYDTLQYILYFDDFYQRSI